MSRITVSSSIDLSPIIWMDMTPWTSSPMTKHVVVAGDRLGKTFYQGRDNATTNLRGRVPWTTAGQRCFDSLSEGLDVTVSNGIDTRVGRVVGVTVNGTDGGAWIAFSLTLTEVYEE